MSLFRITFAGLFLMWGAFANARTVKFSCSYRLYNAQRDYVRTEGPYFVEIDTEENTAEVSYMANNQTFHAEETDRSEYTWIQGGRGVELTLVLNIVTSESGGMMTRNRDGSKIASLMGTCNRLY
jgi:hypothetical protein